MHLGLTSSELLASILSQLSAPASYFVLALVRPLAFIRLFSPFETIARNVIVSSSLALALAFASVPNIIVAQNLPPLGIEGFLIASIREVLIGSTYAILCSIPIKILSTLGEVIDNAQGLSANGPQNPVTRDDATPLSSVATVAFTLIGFHYYFHLDVFQAFLTDSDLLAPVSLRDLKAISAAASTSWLGSVDVLKVLLSKSFVLISLLISVDVAGAFAARHLKSGDLGGLQSIIKICIGSIWLVILGAHIADPRFIPTLQRAFDAIAIPTLP